MLRTDSAKAFLTATCVTACLVGATPSWSAGTDAAPQGAVKLLTTIAIAGNSLAAYDISSVDPVLHHYFLSNRSNSALDIVDTQTNRVVGQVTGFTGPAGGDNNLAGPDGNAPTGDGLVWVGNGDSTVKVVDSRSMTIVQSISTGGTMRADEMAYDAKDKVLLVANDADSPPFVSLIYTPDGYGQVLARITFTNATNGIEASAYDPAKNLFYVNIPQVGSNEHVGEVAVIDPMLRKVIRTNSEGTASLPGWHSDRTRTFFSVVARPTIPPQHRFPSKSSRSERGLC